MRLRILQISDIHIGEEGQLAFEADTHSQFKRVIDSIQGHNPDLIVLSGDFCLDEPKSSTYPWVKDHFEPLDIPVMAIAGNHDNSAMLAEIFHPEIKCDRELYYSKRVQGHKIVFLDSASGRFSTAQWTWLENEIEKTDENTHIFMHHPPIFTGTCFMDNWHAFMEQDRFIALFVGRSFVTHVYCGHYHCPKSLRHGNINIHIAPSTLFQVCSESSEFKIKSTRPGYQLIDLDDDRVEVEVRWV